jgi:hypothetical protein
MKWPLTSHPFPDRKLSLYNRFYLYASKASQFDPTIVWGTEIDGDALQAFLLNRNRQAKVLIRPVHLLIRATAMALEKFPELNVRIVGRRIYALREVNIRMAFYHRHNREIDLIEIGPEYLSKLDRIAGKVWDHLLRAGRGQVSRDRDVARLRKLSGFWLRLIFRSYDFLDRHFKLPIVGRFDGTRLGCVTVNDLSFPGAPPLSSYKPSRFPSLSDSFNLTFGAAEKKVVERNGQFISVNIIPLIVRADHRVVDAYRLGQFIDAVRGILNNPEQVD